MIAEPLPLSPQEFLKQAPRIPIPPHRVGDVQSRRQPRSKDVAANVALFSIQENPAAQRVRGLEDYVGRALLSAPSSYDGPVEVLRDLVEDQQVWELFAQLAEVVTVPTLDEPWQLNVSGASSLVEALVREGCEMARLSTLLTNEIQEKLVSLAGPSTVRQFEATPEQSTIRNAMAFMGLKLHPTVKRVLFEHRLSEVAMVGIGASDRYEYAAGVCNRLSMAFVTGQRGFLSYLMGFAAELGMRLPNTTVAPMDIRTLGREFLEAEQARHDALSKARESGLAVYPPPSDDDEG